MQKDLCSPMKNLEIQTLSHLVAVHSDGKLCSRGLTPSIGVDISLLRASAGPELDSEVFADLTSRLAPTSYIFDVPLLRYSPVSSAHLGHLPSLLFELGLYVEICTRLMSDTCLASCAVRHVRQENASYFPSSALAARSLSYQAGAAL